jgi:hypothetical protein
MKGLMESPDKPATLLAKGKGGDRLKTWKFFPGRFARPALRG